MSAYIRALLFHHRSQQLNNTPSHYYPFLSLRSACRPGSLITLFFFFISKSNSARRPLFSILSMHIYHYVLRAHRIFMDWFALLPRQMKYTSFRWIHECYFFYQIIYSILVHPKWTYMNAFMGIHIHDNTHKGWMRYGNQRVPLNMHEQIIICLWFYFRLNRTHFSALFTPCKFAKAEAWGHFFSTAIIKCMRRGRYYTYMYHQIYKSDNLKSNLQCPRMQKPLAWTKSVHTLLCDIINFLHQHLRATHFESRNTFYIEQ